MLRGGCFCRAVRYEIDAEPDQPDDLPLHDVPARRRRPVGGVVQRAAGRRSGSWPASRSASSRRSTPHAPSAPTAARPDLSIDAHLRRPRHHDLLARRARAGGAQGPHLRAVEAFLGDVPTACPPIRRHGRPANDGRADPAGERRRCRRHRGAACGELALGLSRHPQGQHAWPRARRRAADALAQQARRDDADDTVLIAGDVGFIAVWAEGDPGFGAYIDNLHVHPERRSGGLGRRLLGEAMRRVAESRRDRRLSLGVRRQPAGHRFLSPAGRRDRRTWLRRDRWKAGRAQSHRLA